MRREDCGCYTLLTKELLVEDKNAFKQYLRMDDHCLQELINYVKVDLTKKDTVMRNSISVPEKVALVLRFLASGESFRSLEYQSRLSESIIFITVPEVCEAIYKKLGPEYLKFPSCNEEWINIAKGFEFRWQFPHSLGAIDGKHVAFRASRGHGAIYYNYKGFNSIILLAMCKADYTFTYINFGLNGGCHDAGDLSQSDLNQILYNDDSLSKDEVIGNELNLPYVVIGDDAFPLTKQILKPFPYLVLAMPDRQ
ncbi:putative nuclease HARBI1 [Eupeodes corollae]|uniref:putative nuclease HARBI1 n=1 Tax=Eupeodes corollae TaxID=290404 RepID=UPI00248FD3A5|nr:putative nuclease HARBI1 [Eupeodes corollae]